MPSLREYELAAQVAAGAVRDVLHPRKLTLTERERDECERVALAAIVAWQDQLQLFGHDDLSMRHALESLAP